MRQPDNCFQPYTSNAKETALVAPTLIGENSYACTAAVVVTPFFT
jgi:hypothetical protein